MSEEKSNFIPHNKWRDGFTTVLIPLGVGILIYLLKAHVNMPGFIRHYLPDCLWAFALQSVLLIIWNRQINWYWVTVAMLCGLLVEYGQYKGLISGTADGYDMLVYTFGIFIAIISNKYFNLIFYQNKTDAKQD